MTAPSARETVRDWAYPNEGLPSALQAVLVPSGLPLRRAALPPLSGTTPERWLTEAPRVLGVESLTVRVDPEALLRTLETPGAQLLRLQGARQDLTLAIVGSGGTCTLYLPNGQTRVKSARELVAEVLRASAEGTDETRWVAELPKGAQLLEALATTGELGSQRIHATTFRPDASYSLWTQAKHEGAVAQAVGFGLVSLLRMFVAGASAYALGSAALTGRVDTSRLVGWTLLVLTDIPLAYVTNIALGRLMISVGVAFKRRLLEGTFHLSPDEVRGTGLGRLLARVSEAEVIERGAIAEVTGLVLPIGFWGSAIALAFKGPYAYAVVSGLLAFTVFAVWLAYRTATLYIQQYRNRLDLTDDLVEKIVGHRTRILQRTLDATHEGEDEMLHAYGVGVRSFDRVSTWSTVSPRLWFVLSLGAVLGAFVQREANVLFLVLAVMAARQAWAGINASAAAWAPWYCAYGAVKSLLESGKTVDKPWRPLPEIRTEPGRRPVVVTVSNLSYAQTSTGRSILRDVSLQVAEGERLLLEGPSGSGKSTFAALLASERRPGGGTILVRGLDMDSVPNAEWRLRVAYAPQFHENYIFSSTFAFNLDPRAEIGEISDEARTICQELGLGPLLQRMPSGFVQTLGETGWQLSHGEKSRLYIARTLLQGAELVIFDESFGALDPVILQDVMECVRKRSKTLLVIAHP
ncbi:MAG: ABC transporter ATP-binding protein [Polyangiaceae bacterium]